MVKAQLASCTDGCTVILKAEEKKKSRGREKGADRTAVWRIGAQSEGVEKSLHLNAPLHPNNSSASDKAKKKTPYALSFPLFPLLHSLSEQLWRAHTWLPSIWPCVCARMCIDVSLFKEVLGWVSGVDCSHCQHCSCGFGCHGNNDACTVQSGQSQYYCTALKLPVERAYDRTVVGACLLNIKVQGEKSDWQTFLSTTAPEVPLS